MWNIKLCKKNEFFAIISSKMGILTFQKNGHLPRAILHEMTPESLKSARPSLSSDAERTNLRKKWPNLQSFFAIISSKMGILTFQKNVHLPRVILHKMTPESLKSAQPSRSYDAERTHTRTHARTSVIL